jgi:hypothetical protein
MRDPAPPQPAARYTVYLSRLADLGWCLRDELTRRLLITGTEARVRGAAAHLNLADAILGALEHRGGQGPMVRQVRRRLPTAAGSRARDAVA